MAELREAFLVTFVGGPWEGGYGKMTAPLLNSLDARDPAPKKGPPPGQAPDVVYIWRQTRYEREVNIDALTAGRELDGLVKERVMDTGPGAGPHYSASVSASAELETRLKRLGWTRDDEHRRPGAPPGMSVVVRLRHDDGQVVDATGKTFEEALSKAALKAVEP